MAGDSTVGTLEINLRAGTAIFKGDMEQATALVRNSMAQIETAASAAGERTSGSMMEARHSLMMIGEEFGVHLPRGVTSFIASIGPLGPALEAAFPYAAIVLGATILIEHIGKLGKEAAASAEATRKFAEEIDKSMMDAGQKTLELDEKIAKLTHPDGSVALLDARLRSVKDTLDSLKVSDALDGQIKQLAGSLAQKHWYNPMSWGMAKQSGDLSEFQSRLSLIRDNDLQSKREMTDAEIDAQKTKMETMRTDLTVSSSELNNQHKLIDGLQKLSDELKGLEKQSATGHLADDLGKQAEAAKKAREEVDKLVQGLQRIQSAYPVNKRTTADNFTDEGLRIRRASENRPASVNELLPGVSDADMTGRMRQLQGAGDIFSQIPAPKAPVYTGSDSAMELAKIKAGDQQTMLAAAKQVAASLETENQKWREQLQIVTELHNRGQLTDSQFTEASKQIQEHINGTSTSWRQLGAQIATTAEQAALMGRSWKDVFKSMAVQVTELILKMTLLKDVQGAASGGGGGGGGWGGFFGSLLGGLTHHDIGGSIGPGQWGMTGEKGPEPVYGGVSGVTVFPHGSMRESGGGTVNYYVDASGANAADVEMRVQRALTQVHKSAVVKSVAAQREMSRRMPQGSGKRF